MLEGTALEIWNDFDVLVVSSEKGTEFSEAQLEEIYSVLEALPEENVALLSAITTTAASEDSDDSLLGADGLPVS
ncbi:MAG: hypothetical protein WC335_03890 [Candidatus Omnitrophota bacterium]